MQNINLVFKLSSAFKKRIQDLFRSDGDLGAQLVGSFLLESEALGELSEEQVMQDALQRV